MSIYANLDDGRQFTVGSNTGWGDLCRWIDDLDVNQYAELIHLREYGWSQELGNLSVQLSDAIGKGTPNSNVEHSASILLSILQSKGNASVIVVSEGFVPSDEEGEEEDASA